MLEKLIGGTSMLALAAMLATGSARMRPAIPRPGALTEPCKETEAPCHPKPRP